MPSYKMDFKPGSNYGTSARAVASVSGTGALRAMREEDRAPGQTFFRTAPEKDFGDGWHLYTVLDLHQNPKNMGSELLGDYFVIAQGPYSIDNATNPEEVKKRFYVRKTNAGGVAAIEQLSKAASNPVIKSLIGEGLSARSQRKEGTGVGGNAKKALNAVVSDVGAKTGRLADTGEGRVAPPPGVPASLGSGNLAIGTGTLGVLGASGITERSKRAPTASPAPTLDAGEITLGKLGESLKASGPSHRSVRPTVVAAPAPAPAPEPALDANATARLATMNANTAEFYQKKLAKMTPEEKARELASSTSARAALAFKPKAAPAPAPEPALNANATARLATMNANTAEFYQKKLAKMTPEEKARELASSTSARAAMHFKKKGGAATCKNHRKTYRKASRKDRRRRNTRRRR